MIATKSFLDLTSKHIKRLNSEDRRRSIIDDKKFELAFLRNRCRKLELEQYYDFYMKRLSMSYLKLFILIHLLLVGINLNILVFMSFYVDNNILAAIPYVISVLCAWAILAINFIVDSHDFPWINLATSSAAVIILALSDIGITIYTSHKFSTYFNTVSKAFILYAIYIFLPLRNIQAFVLGILTSSIYLAYYYYTTSHILLDKAFRIEKLLSEGIFLLSLNFVGLFWRILKEINIRITMLDRYKFVEESLMLRYAKEEEQRLLLSVIPGHIVNKIEEHIKSRLQHVMSSRKTGPLIDQRESHRRRPPELEKLFIEPHEDVTILYADIVNFTYLTSTLDVKTLVETLHDLFVKFDIAAKEYKVLRIKFLGDCYYAVAGVSPPNKDHAKSCVDLGLRMIDIIRDVSKNRELNIDMRIGVHTGSIISGVIGASKLQYDIWSKDVDIANRLEQTGVPGRVQVSEETLKHLKGEYMYEKGTPQAKADPLLSKYNITTFLIESLSPFFSDEDDDDINSEDSTSSESLSHFMQHTQKLIDLRNQAKWNIRIELEKMPVAILRLMPTKGTIQDEVEESEQRFRRAISPWFLYYKDWKSEKSYLTEPDDLLKYCVIMGVLIYFAIISIHSITRVQSPKFWLFNNIFIVIMIICIFLTWFKKLWTILCAKSLEEVPNNQLTSFLYICSKRTQSSIIARMIIYLLIVSMQLSAIFKQLLDCMPTLARTVMCGNTFDPWIVTESVKLSILTMFIFTRIPVVVKLALGGLITAIYSYIIFENYLLVYQTSPMTYTTLKSEYTHIYSIINTFVIFYIVDRRREFIWKMDYNLRLQLKNKQEKAEITNASLKLLVFNILPSHVADYYIAHPLIKELYYEEYDNVAVMFATIKQYDIDRAGLRMFNEIICGFDGVLKRFESEGMFKVEKIKLAGWTYMAACGLNIARSQNFTSLSTSGMFNALKSDDYYLQLGSTAKSQGGLGKPKRHSLALSRPGYVAYVMAQYALELMKSMKLFKEENPQWHYGISSEELLRIGISHGPTMAGVIGSSKPIYDIWGNCVNMASRMDSTGVPGYIQVTENTAEALQSYNVHCEFRSMTFVKGCGKIPTYFVGIDEDLKFLPHSTQNTKIHIKKRAGSVIQTD